MTMRARTLLASGCAALVLAVAAPVASAQLRNQEATGPTATKPVDPAAEKRLKVLAEELRCCNLPCTGWVCPRRDGRPGPMPAWLVSQVANRALRDIGVTSTLHQLRHRFGTQVQRAGKDLRRTQEAMRHRSIVSTQLYTLIVADDVHEVVDQIPPPRRTG